MSLISGTSDVVYLAQISERAAGGRSYKMYLPSHCSKLGGFTGKSMFNDASGLQPCLENVGCCSRSVGAGSSDMVLNKPSVGMYLLAVILKISSR